jgi:hypothetical protein
MGLPGNASPQSRGLRTALTIRRTLFQELRPYGDRATVLHDLRIAEVAFRFLLGLRSVRMS